MKNTATPSQRSTKQKTAIITYLRSVKTHPTAEMVYLALKKKMPQLSLGTVYRNLDAYAQEGKSLLFEVKGQQRFDGDVSPHSHFACDACGGVQDLWFALPLPKVKKHLSHGASVRSIDVLIKGQCDTCNVR
ncbi:MAG: transcriptional repressor [Candidatus Azambacteria bacterium]|nr:transcriptional repressor [Candidatus Azambacteria bacterium]